MLWRSAPLLLAFAVLFWAGNSVVGRALAGQAPPIALSWCRWAAAFVLVTPLAWRHLRRDLPELRRRWRIVLALSATGVASFGTLLYIGLQSTTALNSLVMQAAIPPLILLFAWAGLKERVSRLQIVAVAVSLLGVLVVLSRGRPWDLLHLGLNAGDGVIVVAVILYALYSLVLRRRPAVHPLSLIWATFAVTLMLLAPLCLFEAASGQVLRLTPRVIGGIAYVAIFPSFLSYLFFNRGVELIGPARGTQFLHLQPVFGAILAVVLLGEAFHLFHAVGLALIGAGIVLAARQPPTPQPPAARTEASPSR
ncbi:DMT family transporter [Phenylobacterium sp.]|uniref:DMT family transporter n=1 Tax=Phenylobacterium sp. TaxID=1871053 RepID=UPI003783B27D